MLLCGYGKNSYSKFCVRQEEWNNLKRNIPLKYLSVIGAELDQIEKAVQADREEYEAILKLPFFPRNAVVRLMPTVYQEYKFPPFTPEEDCIEIMKAVSKKEGLQTCINYPGVKTIWIEPTGEIRKSYYYPVLTFNSKDRLLVPSYLGQAIGKAYLA